MLRQRSSWPTWDLRECYGNNILGLTLDLLGRYNDPWPTRDLLERYANDLLGQHGTFLSITMVFLANTGLLGRYNDPLGQHGTFLSVTATIFLANTGPS